MSTTSTCTPFTPTGPSAAASARLAPGALRATIAAHLAANPSAAFTVTEVAKALSASGGAVGNALMALAVAGHAQLTCDAPRRFQATDTSGAAAAFTAPPAPKPAPVPNVEVASGPAPVAVPPAAAPVAKQQRGPQHTALVEAKTGAVIRPNGQAYHPRDLGGHRDVEVLAKLREAGIPALLYGPPGTGKTSMVEAAFGDLITVAGDNDTTVADLVHRAELHRIRYSSPGDPGADVQDQGIGCRRALPVGAGFESLRNQFNDVALYATWRELLISRARRTCCSLTGSSTWTRRRRCSTR